jgi:hypothetical protein
MKGPFSVMKSPKNALGNELHRTTSREDVLNKQEEEDARKKLSQKKADKISEILGAKYSITQKTWVFLHRMVNGVSVQPSVSQYFPDHKVAVDKFYSMSEFLAKQEEIAFKTKRFKENHIRYCACGPTTRLIDIQEALGV